MESLSNYVFVKSEEINQVFYDKKKYVSHYIMKEYPEIYKNTKYDVNDKIVLTNMKNGRFNNGVYQFDDYSIVDILYRLIPEK